MKLLLTQAGPGLTVQQAGQGPVVSVNFGPAGAPAVLATLPESGALQDGDQLLLVRAGLLYAAPISAVAAAIDSATDNIVLES